MDLSVSPYKCTIKILDDPEFKQEMEFLLKGDDALSALRVNKNKTENIKSELFTDDCEKYASFSENLGNRMWVNDVCINRSGSPDFIGTETELSVMVNPNIVIPVGSVSSATDDENEDFPPDCANLPVVVKSEPLDIEIKQEPGVYSAENTSVLNDMEIVFVNDDNKPVNLIKLISEPENAPNSDNPNTSVKKRKYRRSKVKSKEPKSIQGSESSSEQNLDTGDHVTKDTATGTKPKLNEVASSSDINALLHKYVKSKSKGIVLLNDIKVEDDEKDTKDICQSVYPKPVFSYSCLIAMALKNSKDGCLPVSEIYNFMCENFPYFRTAPTGWKNSVRHNLSLNKCFEKKDRPPGCANKKGCLWALNPNKIERVDDEVRKYTTKEKSKLKDSMANPGDLELLENGTLIKTYQNGRIYDSDLLDGTLSEDTEGDEAQYNIDDELPLIDVDVNDLPDFSADGNNLYEELVGNIDSMELFNSPLWNPAENMEEEKYDTEMLVHPPILNFDEQKTETKFKVSKCRRTKRSNSLRQRKLSRSSKTNARSCSESSDVLHNSITHIRHYSEGNDLLSTATNTGSETVCDASITNEILQNGTSSDILWTENKFTTATSSNILSNETSVRNFVKIREALTKSTRKKFSVSNLVTAIGDVTEGDVKKFTDGISNGGFSTVCDNNMLLDNLTSATCSGSKNDVILKKGNVRKFFKNNSSVMESRNSSALLSVTDINSYFGNSELNGTVIGNLPNAAKEITENGTALSKMVSKSVGSLRNLTDVGNKGKIVLPNDVTKIGSLPVSFETFDRNNSVATSNLSNDNNLLAKDVATNVTSSVYHSSDEDNNFDHYDINQLLHLRDVPTKRYHSTARYATANRKISKGTNRGTFRKKFFSV